MSASPSFLSAGAGAQATSGVITTPVPSGVASGDLMLLFVQSQYGNNSITPPSGWSLVDGYGAGAGQFVREYEVYWKLATSSEPTSYAVTISGPTSAFGGAVMAAWRGDGTALSIQAHANTHSSTATTNVVTPSLPTGDPNITIIYAYGNNGVNGTEETYTLPSGLTRRVHYRPPETGYTMEMSDMAQATVGATPSQTITASTSDSYAAIALSITQASNSTAPAATSVTLSGPTSGLVGSPSSNFTVGANGSITGTVTVTPSDSGGGGTFSPTSVNISLSTPTATFTYTAASTGAKTISVTNNGSLSNPSSITYTASAAASAVTLSGPSTSNVGSPSTNFTVGANGVMSGNITVTPSDNGGGGSFSPTSVTIGPSTLTATFTYTAASAGAKSISVSNTGGLSNPSALTCTASVVNATAVTMTGPTSGVNGQASTNFTVGANGSLTGTVTVTPSDSGAGGVFTPSSVLLSSSSPTAAFTYTPATTGAKTISVTNNGSLTNPSSITYTVSAASGSINWPKPIAPINGTPWLSTGHRIVVRDMITDLVVVRKTGLVTNATTGFPPTITDASIVPGTKYECTIKLDSDNTAVGTEFITAV